jgi:predicted XRE-type DNA-binding protein
METWKDVVGYERLYMVSDERTIFDHVRKCHRKIKGLILKQHLIGPPNGTQYLSVSLSKDGKQKKKRVHKLVIQAFRGECPKGMVCCHGKNGALDNSLSNLYYATQQRNCSEDKLRDGTLLRGEQHPNTNLTEEQVRQIFTLAWEGRMKQKEIAEMFNVSKNTVRQLKCGSRWGFLGLKPPNQEKEKAIKEEEVKEIFTLAWEGKMTQKEMAEMFNVSQATISHIKFRKTWASNYIPYKI